MMGRWRSEAVKPCELDPDQLDHIVRQRHGFVAFEELENAERAAPGFGEVFRNWGRGLTMTNAGIPASDWLAFLDWLRREREGCR